MGKGWRGEAVLRAEESVANAKRCGRPAPGRKSHRFELPRDASACTAHSLATPCPLDPTGMGRQGN
eukprot:3540908-Alexandrium_andersonii.AAC.1